MLHSNIKKIKNMKKIILSLFIFSVIGCGEKSENKTAEVAANETESSIVKLTSAQIANAEIKTAAMVEKEISATLKLNGKIDVPPQNLISVSVPLGGYLKSTDMLPGKVVRKGQILAVLEDQQYVRLQQDYLLAKVKLKVVEGEYMRQKELNASKAASDKIVQIAEGEYKNAKINLKALEENLELIGIQPKQLDENKISKRITITSPINGYVSKVNANIGKYLTPSEVLFELVNVSDIHLNISVFEKDLASLAIGQKVITYNNSNPSKKYETEIILIGHSLSVDKNTEVHCHFKKYDKTLVPGMYMNAEVELKNVKAHTISENAILRYGNKDYVFIQGSNNTYEMIPVNVGAKENGSVEIKNFTDLNGMPVVINGAYSLLMKLKNIES
jgi:cobalt-zinc-cadmium efflux system membrane fusion protein